MLKTTQAGKKKRWQENVDFLSDKKLLKRNTYMHFVLDDSSYKNTFCKAVTGRQAV